MSFKLYPFQEEDVTKLERVLAALIGSEMGTGKTHEGVALEEIWSPVVSNLRTLIVAPLNTFDVWQEKFGVQAPQYDITVMERTKGTKEDQRDRFIANVEHKRGDIFLCHWESLRLMPELREFEYGLVIADEVHRAANRKAQATRALKQLRTRRKLGMSGTASGDKPENLWSVLHWLYPMDFRSYWRFRKRYCTEDIVHRGRAKYTQITGTQNEAELHRILAPFYVRHLKREPCCEQHPHGVMDWLAEKTYDTIWVDLSPKQRRIYEQMRREMVAWVGENEDTPLVASVVVAKMVRLSQIALATPFFDEDGRVRLQAPSSKIDVVKELILDHGNKRFVVYSASKQACYLAQAEFSRAGISSAVFSGDTSDADRDAIKRDFGRGDLQAFIGVIEAAGEGIDGLQHATDTAIFLDRSWRTIKNLQAEDRLHRDGQKDTVQIIDIMARNTLDWGRHQKLLTKWRWIKAILGDNEYAAQHLLQGANDLQAEAISDALAMFGG